MSSGGRKKLIIAVSISLAAVIVMIAVLIAVASLKKQQPVRQYDTTFTGYNFKQVTASNIPVTYTPLNMATQYMQDSGIYGDGCQWPVSFESSADGSLMLYGIDVAGLYRSVDHGATWQKCNTGITSRGVGMFGIDPKNSSHVVAAGLSGSSAKNTGFYISYDACQTWKATGFNVKIGGERYLWDGLQFDPTSYSASENMCMTAYYSIPYQRDRATRLNAYALSSPEHTLKDGEQGLYKSTDGGESFVQISSDYRLADGIVRITDNGSILIGNQHGLFLIDGDGQIKDSWLLNPFTDYENDKITINLSAGGTAEILRCYLGITGLDCVGNTIYAQTWDGIYTLDFTSAAVTPQLIVSENYKTENWGQFICVSQSNPLHMAYQYRSRVGKVSWDTYWVNYIDTSFDGGKTWTTAVADGNSVFTAGNWAGREKLIIIDPSNDSNVLCFGSDTIMRSVDGGLNFVQASGVSNMMCGGKMHLNYYDDSIILAGAQDYGGTVSLDGGKTFKRLLIKGDGVNYGHMYDAFAADAYTYYGFARNSWYGENHLVVTFNGGASWTDTGIVIPYGTPTSSVQSYNNPDILFAGCYRSTDRGRNWKKMKDCICVSTVSYGDGHALIGYDEQRNILMSPDDGGKWVKVFDRQTHKFNDSPRTVSESIRDLSFDFVNNIIYTVVDSHHKSSDGTEYNSHNFYKVLLDENLQFKERKLIKIHDSGDGYANYSDIEVDPNCTSVIYAACAGNYFSNRYALQRSIDGGETWQVLTSNTDPEGNTKGLCNNRGGYEASMLAVDPLTGRVLVGCGCYGFEWITPPYDSSALDHTAPPEHTVTFVYDGKTVHTESVKNNRTFTYTYDIDGKTFEGWYEDSNFKTKWDGGCVYKPITLYAKMRPAQQITFYVNGKIFARHDIEESDTPFEIPIPEQSGYIFAGWYTSEKLTSLASFDNLEKSVNVYAAFYKAGENLFDMSIPDFNAYIQYSNRRLSSTDRAEEDEACDNRCAYIQIEEQGKYLLTFKMDVRCRYGLSKGDFAKNKEPDIYFIDEKDTNGSTPVDEWVYLTFDSGECNKLLLFYYTSASDSSLSYRQIRETIGCYKTEEEMCYLIG